jgi:hypothetical protein
MTAFNLVAGICGIVAFIVLCVQGAPLLKTEEHVWLTRDAARSLHLAKEACKKRKLDCAELRGTAAGVQVSGRAYKVRSARRQGERENWLSPVEASRREFG